MSRIKEQDILRDLLPPTSEFDKTEAVGTLKAFAFIKERASPGSHSDAKLANA
jgi:hypothetical protein